MMPSGVLNGRCSREDVGELQGIEGRSRDMGGERRAIEPRHGFGYEGRIAGQLEGGIGDAPPGAPEVCVGAAAGQLARAAGVAKRAPQHEPTVLDRGDLDEAAEVFPDERGRGGHFGQTEKR